MVRAEFNDFSTPYVSARLWLHGSDPYSHNLFKPEWISAGGVPFVTRGSSTTTRPAYPPPTLPVLLPFALLPWQLARIAFAALATVLYGVILWRLRSAPTITLAIILAMSAVGTAIGGGNIAILAIELAVLSSLCSSRTSAGLLLGLSICLKPQLAIWLVLYYILTRQWKVSGAAIGVVASSAAVAYFRLPPTWFASYTENLSHFFAIGGVNDFTSGNPSRFELLNLQVVAYSATHDYAFSNVIAWTVTGTLLALWTVWCLRRDRGLLAMGTVTAVGLLPVYQRFYNLPIVLLIMVWAIQNNHLWLQRLFTLFIVPWTAIIARLSNDRWMTGPIYAQNWLAQLVVLPWTTWFLIGLVVFGLWQMRPQRRPAPVRLRLPRVAPNNSSDPVPL